MNIQQRMLTGAVALGLTLVATVACSKDDAGTAATVAAANAATAAASVDTNSANYAVSYLTGYQIGANMKASGLTDVDVDTLAAAIADALAGKDNPLTEEQQQAGREAQQAARQSAMEKQREEARLAGEANKKAGADFLAENGQRDGVMTTESGLQYEVLTDAEGDKPSADDTVKVHYAGTLIDGTPFDSSYDRGEPAQFPLKGVISGWTEGLQLMPVGSKYKFFIPSELAYGEQQRGPVIKANSTLVFEVELLEIVKPDAG